MKLRVNPIITLLSIMFLFFLVFVLQISMKVMDMDRKMDRLNVDDSIYLQLQQESSPFKPDRGGYEDMLAKLQDSTLFTYYEIYGQPLNVEEDIFGEVSDTGLPCVQIGENVTDDFDIEAVSGRTFTSTDFIFNGAGSIPVILGNAYRGQIDLDTQFQGEYLYDTYDFIIIGILKENSQINLGFKSYLLDESVIMPSFEMIDTARFTDSIKIHYANKTSGVVKASSETWEDVESYINEIISNSQSGRYSWYSNSIRINFRQMIGVDAINLAALSIVGIFLTATFYLFVLCKKVKFGNYGWKMNCPDVLCQSVIYIVLSAVQLLVLNKVIYFIGFKLQYSVTLLLVLVILLIIDLLTYFFVKRIKSCVA